MSKIFIYDNEIFNAQLLVCVSVSAKQIKAWADKNSKKYLKKILETKTNIELLEKAVETNNGSIMLFKKNNSNYYILWLKNFKNSWQELDILNHEIVHYRQYQFSDKQIINENEFEAYFEESVFRSIRRLLVKNL